MANDDIDVELGQSVRRHIEQKSSPHDDPAFCALPYDRPDADQIPVFVAESVMRRIEGHVLRQKDKEVGGVLLGAFYREDKGSFVEVTDFVEAAAANGTDVSLTFTHETWEGITREQARRAPESQIVGWYHSHPGLGVFMSKEDEFIHSSFFTDPWHVALVVDPIYHNWGCFKWNDGALERTSGFYVFAEKQATRRVRDYVKTISAARQAPPASASASADRRGLAAGSTAALWAVVGLLVVSQIIVLWLVIARPRIDYMSAAVQRLKRSDLSGGAHYLSMEVARNQRNRDAVMELWRVQQILADPAIYRLSDDDLDAANSRLMIADEMAHHQVDYWKLPWWDELLGRSANREVKDSPASKALEVYEQARGTWNQRLARAELIKDKAKAVKGSAVDKWPGDSWYSDALTWLQNENVRRIAYGRALKLQKYAAERKKLIPKDQDAVDRIYEKLKRPAR